MKTNAIVFREPEKLRVEDIDLTVPTGDEIVVETLWSGISSGTERMLLEGTMPPFPGMGYPLVPGYESVGRVTRSVPQSDIEAGTLVFVPGARGYVDARGLFGATASHLIADASKVVPLPESLGEQGTLLALAATAHHALALAGTKLPDLVIGHGVLGQLIARTAIALGGAAPTVWEPSARRREIETGYPIVDGAKDTKTDYTSIIDASGDPTILDTAIAHMARGGEIVLAGFYRDPLSFTFPAAFMREARFRVAAEFDRFDTDAVLALVADGRLSLDGLISHRANPQDAKDAYDTAFNDPDCLKMILDWRTCS